MGNKLNIQEVSCNNKRIIMRVDFNVPLDSEQNITDDTRITATIPTIEHILAQNTSLILMSHLGRPKGAVNHKLSLKPVQKKLEQLLSRPVQLANACTDLKTQEQVKNLKPGDILLLENLRFNKAEEKPEEDSSFAQTLGNYADIYVNDAFGSCHRNHSSVTSITKFYPNQSTAGFLLQKEINFLHPLVTNPKRPFCAIVGGAKVSSKIGVLKSLCQHTDILLIGGAMAFTFLKALGFEVGISLVEPNFLDAAKEIINECKKNNTKLLLPQDICAAKQCRQNEEVHIISMEKGIPPSLMGLDIGPKTTHDFSTHIAQSATILWNGPMGVFEIADFSKGTFSIAESLKNCPGTTIVGGGDSIAALKAANMDQYIDHISTGGGASLEFIQFGTLPGIEALSPSNSTSPV